MAVKQRKAGDADATSLSAMRRQAILDLRRQQLAGRASVAAETPSERLLLCEIGRNLFGLPLSDVAKVRPFDRIGAAPRRDAAALGLVVEAGAILPALDLGALLGLGPASATAGGWLLILAPPQTVALRVEDLPGAVDVEPIEGDADHARILAGPHRDKILARLSAADLLSTYATPLHGAVAP